MLSSYLRTSAVQLLQIPSTEVGGVMTGNHLRDVELFAFAFCE